jgi:HAE1 family hydrophobic/amphiphilic exporter-1
VVISVFLPIAFLSGTVGQFFRQFGMTVCFAMAVSLFEAMVMGPMLSAYWAKKVGTGWSFIDALDNWFSPLLKSFDRFQTGLEKRYEALIVWCVSENKLLGFLSHRAAVLLVAFALFVASLFAGPKFTFLPNGDNGEFMVSLKAAPNTSLDAMREKTLKVAQIIRAHKEIELTSEVVGDTQGNDNQSTIYAKLVPWESRSVPFWDGLKARLSGHPMKDVTTSDMKDIARQELEPFRAELNPQVGDRDLVGNMAPFNMVLAGDDYKTLQPLADEILAKFKDITGLTDAQTNYDGGKPEFQAVMDPDKCRQLGVLGIEAGTELRTQVEGAIPAKFRENGLEYDIRVRMQDDQRDLQKDFDSVWVPNSNHLQVKLSDIAKPVTTVGPSKINRLNRQRYIMVSGQLGKGAALGTIQTQAEKIMGSMKLPPDVSYSFIGQAEDMKDLMTSMVMAIGLALLFTFMILASLYESPILPVTIMMSIPLAIVGALVALRVTDQSLNIFSMISVVMLMGLVTKNSILLVDYTVQMEKKGVPRNEAIRRAGIVRLRPILMTTLALIAGMVPTAMALTEVARFRQSMGVAVIGGLVSSLFLTLLVVPSVYGYVDDLRLWMRRVFNLAAEAPKPKI